MESSAVFITAPWKEVVYCNFKTLVLNLNIVSFSEIRCKETLVILLKHVKPSVWSFAAYLSFFRVWPLESLLHGRPIHHTAQIAASQNSSSKPGRPVCICNCSSKAK